jgi:hypothetical protein
MDAAPQPRSASIRRTCAAARDLPRVDGPERTDRVVGPSRLRFAVGRVDLRWEDTTVWPCTSCPTANPTRDRRVRNRDSGAAGVYLELGSRAALQATRWSRSNFTMPGRQIWC